MKKFLLSLLFIGVLFISPTKASETAPIKLDKQLILKLADNYGTKVVQVSFEGVENPIGQLEVTNQTNKVVLLVEVFEVVNSPNYATINASEFTSGEYTFTLKGKFGSYSTKITIQ